MHLLKKGLVIVESPAKAKTIQKYLGSDYLVKASVGHIKDLPKSGLGVDTTSFEADFEVLASKKKTVQGLKTAAEHASALYLATDPDREGEAIAWHIQEELQGSLVYRVLFHSITEESIRKAMAHPQALNLPKYQAQQARRILDRLVGYKISPILWEKVRWGLSAGRVQSVALRFLVDREQAIVTFVPQEYWTIHGEFSQEGTSFQAKYFKIQGKDPELTNEAQAKERIEQLQSLSFSVQKIEKKQHLRKPLPPFITSKLQQEASVQFKWNGKKTMAVAQRLYEGVNLGKRGTHGLITYMRTDSTRVDPQVQEEARAFIQTHYGERYLPQKKPSYTTKQKAQDAHEAIRPCTLKWPPESIHSSLDPEEARLYQLIWTRFLGSQMAAAVYDKTTVELSATDPDEQLHTFRALGSVLIFPGFLILEPKKMQQSITLPELQEKTAVLCHKLEPSQHFTEPKPRYTDASLIEELEKQGIGRPSTYASILHALEERKYLEKRENHYHPTSLGTTVTELLQASFSELLDAKFTAQMEGQLDAIEEEQANWKQVLQTFWQSFEAALKLARQQMKSMKKSEAVTSLFCQCSHPFVVKWGKHGAFLACSNYPVCQCTEDFVEEEPGNLKIVPKPVIDQSCPHCHQKLTLKNGKFGKFLACPSYPECKFTQVPSLGVKCPECSSGELARKRSKKGHFFYGCNQWPRCNFALWDPPIVKSCPQCQFPLLIEKTTRRAGPTHRCFQKGCSYFEVVEHISYSPPSERTRL